MSGVRSCTVFIGNIPYDATEDDLRAVFCKVGSIDSLRLVYDKETKQPKGYAFCDYSDPDTALSAIRNLNEVECNGRRLRIDLADNALRGGKGGGGGLGGALPLALPAPEIRNRVPTGPTSLSSFPPPSSSLGPVPVGPPLPAGGPMRPPGPPGSMGGPRPEEVMAAVHAHSDIAQTIAAMPQAQLQLCLGAMQRLAVEAPEGSRAFLQENPQLCYALLHAQLLLGLELQPSLPATAEEAQGLRMECARRPMLGGMPPPGMVVPPIHPGFLGGPRPCGMGFAGMAGYGIRGGFVANFGAAFTGGGCNRIGPYAPVMQPGLQQPMVVGPPVPPVPPKVMT